MMQSVSVATRHLLFVYLLTIIFVLAANADAVVFIMDKWLQMDHGTYNHGLLLLAMCIFLFFKKIEKIKLQHKSMQQLIALIATILLLIGAFLLSLIGISSIQALFVYVACTVLFLAFFGWQAMKTMLVPFGLLVFALPLWEWVGNLLQWITAYMSYAMVYLSGIPVLKEGYLIIVPAGRFEVAPSCSGVSYFLAASALAIFYAELNYSALKPRLVVISSLVIASIVANWIRVYIVVMAGQMTNMQHPLVNDHFNLGWMIFGIFFIVLLVLFRNKLSDEPLTTSQQNNSEQIVANSQNWQKYFVAVPVLVLLVATFSTKSYLLSEAEDNQVAPLLFPEKNRLSEATINLGSRFTGAVEHYYKINEDNGIVQIYHGFYAQQFQDNELISDLNHVVDQEFWTIEQSNTMNISDKQISVLDINSKLSANKYIVWYWYRVGGISTPSAFYAKLYQLPGLLKHDRSAEVYVLVSEAENNQLLRKVFNTLSNQIKETN